LKQELNGGTYETEKRCGVVLCGGPDSTVVPTGENKVFSLNCLSFKDGRCEKETGKQG
jgi:hypothetical protein